MKTKIINNEKLNSLLPSIERRIKELFGSKVVKIILFGSYAREDYNEESDVDILVIVDDEKLDLYKKMSMEITNYYLDKENILLSIIIEKASLAERYKDHSPFLININKEGVVLYG